jgi:hypothetical protein
MYSEYKKCVLVIHCVDSEGPIGGDVRRKPDGSKEFMDNWPDIKASLNRLLNDDFRKKSCDSFGHPYIFNWFIMDFTGFRTNPKNRICEYNNTYDSIKSLNTSQDNFYWHEHHPAENGVGDRWSNSWDSSNEHLNILLHRIVEREDFPEAFRAGGTIEDSKCSLWLEDNIMIDYSNRVSNRSKPTDNISDFNWYGAPNHWRYYHPNPDDFLKKGDMRRYIVRCVDLRSRLHELQEFEVEECFAQAKKENKPAILSYFSHDHRDMNDETRYVIRLINKVSKRFGTPWKVCNALEAVQICEGIKPVFVNVDWKIKNNFLSLTFDKEIYQKLPLVGIQKTNGDLELRRGFELELPKDTKKVVIAGTSMTGNKFIKKIKL